MTDQDPNRKTALDYYYDEFRAKRDIVKVKQSRLHAVRGWIATTVDPNVHKVAIRDIRKKLDRRPVDDDADETDDVSVREIVVYLRNKFAPNSMNIRTGILKKYNQHLEEAKRANTNFDTWIAHHPLLSIDVCFFRVVISWASVQFLSNVPNGDLVDIWIDGGADPSSNSVQSTLLDLDDVPFRLELVIIVVQCRLSVWILVGHVVLGFGAEDLKALIAGLKDHYELDARGEANFFLGIQLFRDRKNRKVYLSHEVLISKVGDKFNQTARATFPAIPIPAVEYRKYDAVADKATIKKYQEKIGSILYTAIMIRPDVAFAASKLSQFLTNPGPEHMRAADQVIRYLVLTKHLALCFGGVGEMRAIQIASDASCADDPATEDIDVVPPDVESQALKGLADASRMPNIASSWASISWALAKGLSSDKYREAVIASSGWYTKC
ncbi:uncharacterized protein CPUR_04498 [Claviceps purpurea 20.1]|uniref:Reverse transcriptase Ty1/copia-type domain-containing protein n=1 Tax=Claviceps purpurea (strain 20.1) TaxID=1111077 RepID=M1WF63_CLAP2|nr:uncharacterized protein CPUR_04498 [Claviceps purpurea 20.1]